MKKVLLMILCTFPLWINAQVNDFRKVAGMKNERLERMPEFNRFMEKQPEALKLINKKPFTLRSTTTEIQVLDSIIYDVLHCGGMERPGNEPDDEICSNSGCIAVRCKDEYRYDTKGNMILSTTYRLESYATWTEWIEEWQEEYRYDDKNNLTSVIEYSRSDYNTWVRENRYEYQYDENNNQTSAIGYRWENGRWEERQRWEYQYDENNNLISDVEHSFRCNWVGEPMPIQVCDWVESSKGEYQYDDRNNQISALFSYSWDGGYWVNSKVEYKYDDNNNQIEYVYYWQDGDTWIKSQKEEYQYDYNHNRISEIFYSWDIDTGTWKEDSKWEFEYQYDDNNMPVSGIWYYSDECNRLMTLTAEYYYSTLTVSSISQNYSGLSDVVAYPNPAKDYIIIKGERASIITVSGLSGSIIYKQTMQNERESINVSSWANGVYIITVETKNKKITSKIVKE